MHHYVALVLAHDRPGHLRQALDSLLAAAGATAVPIVVSQDGANEDVQAVIEGFCPPVERILHTARPPTRGDGYPSPVHGYRCIAAHYRWALSRLFEGWPTDHVIVTEDDLVVAPDVFRFFDACLDAVGPDPTLWAISAWNDNGQPEFVADSGRIVRSDWFPNLGVSISRRLWSEIEPHWPEVYWDDWLRAPSQRRGRVTLRPEVSRVIHTGAAGASFGQFFEQHTGRVTLPAGPATFGDLDPATLHEAEYDRTYLERVRAATDVTIDAMPEVAGDRRIIYRDFEEFRWLAGRLGLMADVRHGTPRTAYRGIVECRQRDCMLFLAPAGRFD